MTSTTGGGGIRRVDPDKGYGTITPDDGSKDSYFEFSVVEGPEIPKTGKRVETRAELKGHGPQGYEGGACQPALTQTLPGRPARRDEPPGAALPLWVSPWGGSRWPHELV